MTTIILPFRQSLARPEAILRLVKMLAFLKRRFPEHKIIVSDQSLVPTARLFCRDFDYVWQPRSIYSPASCKNAGAALVTTGSVVFIDIDVIPTRLLFDLVKDIETGAAKMPFIWFPVLFLNRKIAFSEALKRMGAAAPDFNAAEQSHLGYATGIQAFLIEAFNEIGGYDEKFIGYGDEDFDMIHRMLVKNRHFSPAMLTEDYLVDHRTKLRAEFKGFRKFFAEVIESLVDTQKVYCVHVWHRRRAFMKFRQVRKNNDSYFIAKLGRPEKRQAEGGQT